MKLKNILRVASVLLAGSLANQALALTPSTAPDFTLYSSGASAQQQTIQALFTSYCNNDLHVYRDRPFNTATNTQVGTSVGGAWRAFYCTFKNDPLVVTDAQLRGRKVLVLNRARGGSVWGVVPVQKNMPVEQMNIFRAGSGRDCTLVSGNATAGTYNCNVEADSASAANVAAFRAANTALDATLNSRECIIGAAGLPLVTLETTPGSTRDTVCKSSHAGISDVEPALFNSPTNRPAFPTAADSLPNLTLTTRPAYGVMFGVPVTNDVYDVLQTNQNLTVDGTPTGVRCDSLVPRNRVIGSPCQPSLSKPEITAIFTGVITDWIQMGVDLSAAGNPNGEMIICRRVVGSGTQASANVYFTGNPCLTGAPGGQKDFVRVSDTTGTGYSVSAGSGTGNVVACLNAAFAGNTTSLDAIGIQGRTGGIGISSLERLPSATDNWSYIRISHVAPLVSNYLNGKYDFAFENTIQYNSSLVTTSLEGRLVAELQAQAPNPTFLGASGATGVASLCSLFPGGPVGPGAPITRMTRGGNSCAVASICP